MTPFRRRRGARWAGTAAPALAVAACSSGTSGSTAPSAAPSTAAGTSSTANPAVQKSVDAANAFLATLDDNQRKTVQFAWTDTAQKQRWSNFPNVAFSRAGLEWGDLSTAQQNAWPTLEQASLSTEGHNRLLAEWGSDDANAAETGQSDIFGKKYAASWPWAPRPGSSPAPRR